MLIALSILIILLGLYTCHTAQDESDQEIGGLILLVIGAFILIVNI